MSLESLLTKIQRLHSAVGSATELDISKFPPTVVQDAGGLVSVHQDFNGGLTQADLLNLAYQVIRSIADLKDHLRACARTHHHDLADVERTIDGCLDLALMIDLANSDKHSGMPRLADQRSKRSPRLVEVKRVMQVVLRNAQPGTVFGLRLTPQGAIPAGPGAASVVVTGDIIDDKGTSIRVLPHAQQTAIEAWEQLLTRWGSSNPSNYAVTRPPRSHTAGT